MKRFLCLILAALMMLTQCACATQTPTTEPTTEPTKDNRVELTLQNYSQYLEIRSAASNYYSGGLATFSDSIRLSAYVEGKSTNFNYYNISVTVEVTAKTTLAGKPKSFTKTLTVTLDIAGNGDNSASESLGGWFGAMQIEHPTSTFKVISISGYVEPA